MGHGDQAASCLLMLAVILIEVLCAHIRRWHQEMAEFPLRAKVDDRGWCWEESLAQLSLQLCGQTQAGEGPVQGSLRLYMGF